MDAKEIFGAQVGILSKMGCQTMADTLPNIGVKLVFQLKALFLNKRSLFYPTFGALTCHCPPSFCHCRGTVDGSPENV